MKFSSADVYGIYKVVISSVLFLRFTEPAPRRMLISGLKAKELVVSSPLLQFYLHRGLIVKKLHEFIEYNSMDCFSPFRDLVTSARRSGTALQAQTCKLMGNAGYAQNTLYNQVQ